MHALASGYANRHPHFAFGKAPYVAKCSEIHFLDIAELRNFPTGCNVKVLQEPNQQFSMLEQF